MKHLPSIRRRTALLGLGSAMVLGRASLAMAAADTDKRLVVVLLRGAMDGLAAVVPYGDPDLVRWRPELVPPQPGQPGGSLDLGGFYGLHPALVGMHDLYRAGELLPVHAVAGHYRSRSHFEAQDYLESGVDRRMDSGWLNRTLAALPGPEQSAVAVSVTVPLILRGASPVATWAPATFDPLDLDLYQRVVALHAHDAVTGPALRNALRERGFSDEVLASGLPAAGQGAFATLCASAAKLLSAPAGPRVAGMELEGWDTHSSQPTRIAAALEELDAGLVALKAGLGEAWAQTVVLVITEFGRTVRADGTLGTDHGTGTAAFVAGGRVAGGRVMATWPTLKQGALFENRDLQPTLDLRALGKGILSSHLGLSPAALATVFPDSAGVGPAAGILRT